MVNTKIPKLNQRTIGPVDAHLIPGIYIQILLYMYSYIAVEQGQNTHWVQKWFKLYFDYFINTIQENYIQDLTISRRLVLSSFPEVQFSS